MEIDASVASLIVGVSTAVVLAAGHFLARRGQKEQAEQQRAANNLAAVERQRDRAEAAEVRERERADRERDRADRLEEANDELRETHRKRLNAFDVMHREAIAEQTASCRAEVKRLSDTLLLMQQVLHNEVAKTAAEQAIRSVSNHPHDDPVDEWLNSPPSALGDNE